MERQAVLEAAKRADTVIQIHDVLIAVQGNLMECLGELTILRGFYKGIEDPTVFEGRELFHLVDATGRMLDGIQENVKSALQRVDDVA